MNWCTLVICLCKLNVIQIKPCLGSFKLLRLSVLVSWGSLWFWYLTIWVSNGKPCQSIFQLVQISVILVITEYRWYWSTNSRSCLQEYIFLISQGTFCFLLHISIIIWENYNDGFHQKLELSSDLFGVWGCSIQATPTCTLLSVTSNPHLYIDSLIQFLWIPFWVLDFHFKVLLLASFWPVSFSVYLC